MNTAPTAPCGADRLDAVANENTPSETGYKVEEGIVHTIAVQSVMDMNGEPARRTSFTLEGDPGKLYAAAFGNDFDETEVPRGSRIRFAYVERPGTSRVTGLPVTWRNLVHNPVVLRPEVVVPDVEYPWLGTAGRVQHGTGSRTDSVTLVDHMIGNVNRAHRQFRTLSGRGPMPREMAERIADAVSNLGIEVREALATAI